MATAPVGGRLADMHALSALRLDNNNPRFGGERFTLDAQQQILDHIVTTFGVGDVLSSLAVNGYFRAEPLVGRRQQDGSVVIAEGNRRLAACLILSRDARASNQSRLGDAARSTWEDHGQPSIDPVPVITFESSEDPRELLSYLGVRHISASAPWDSYAKAVWVSRVVEASELTVAEVSQMVGDQHRTVARLLEGYYVASQAEAVGQFHPADSQKSGRGSVTAYPFSWVYTILGYATTRSFLGLTDEPPRPNPIPADRLSNLGIVFRAMFGSRAAGRSSAVSDSRELGDLASLFGYPERIAMLERGLSVSQIVQATRPLDERLRLGLAEVRLLQQEIITGLTEEDVPSVVAATHIEGAALNRRLGAEIETRLRNIVVPPSDA